MGQMHYLTFKTAVAKFHLSGNNKKIEKRKKILNVQYI